MFVLLMEPYAMIQVSVLLQPYRIVFANFIPSNFGGIPDIYSRNPEVHRTSRFREYQNPG